MSGYEDACGEELGEGSLGLCVGVYLSDEIVRRFRGEQRNPLQVFWEEGWTF